MTQDSVKVPIERHNPESYDEIRSFLSLKWKISLLSSLILLAVVLLFCTISYLGLMDNFENISNSEYQRNEREVDTLVKSSSQELRQIAEMIPFLEGMSKVLHQGDKERINSIFGQHWSLLQFHNGIELLRFYSRSNQLVVDWEIDSNLYEHQSMQSWVEDVNLSEQPISPLLCRKSCIQFFVAPLLVEGKNAGVVVIGISLADAFLRFKSVSGADVGLFVNEQDNVMKQDEMLMQDWGVRLTALTNKKETLKYSSKQFRNTQVLLAWRKAF